MSNKKILYFSVDTHHVEDFNAWARKMRPIEWIDKGFGEPSVDDLPQIISEQADKALLCVIIDYLSIMNVVAETSPNNGGDVTASSSLYEKYATKVRLTILQFPEVNFFFDQSGVPDDCLSGIEFLLGRIRKGFIASQVAQGFHVFRREDGFAFFNLDYDNIFDASNLRWAIRKKYFEELELENADGNFEQLQTARKDSLAVVVDDEPRQGRFNGFSLYSSGYRVMLVRTARMLLSLKSYLEQLNATPQIVVRDFDLQFPDASKRTDYDENTGKYKECITWEEDWKMKIGFQDVDLKPFDVKLGCTEYPAKMIDAIRGYRFYVEEDGPLSQWVDVYNDIENNNSWRNISPFWGWTEQKKDESNGNKEVQTPIYVYVVTNGHEKMDISNSRYEKWEINRNERLEVRGIEKPVSGLYIPFFTNFKDVHGDFIVKKQFDNTRYKENKEGYKIDKRRKNHNHGVPVGIYDTVCEMLGRAEDYYEEKCYIKSAVLSQETIELLNGFHYQLMIRAYRLKYLAENSIAMDVVGADEKQLVLDAEERIKIIKEDIHRIVFSQSHGTENESVKSKIHRMEKEKELLDHIFSDCRDICHKCGYFEVEDVFISAMAHTNDGYSLCLLIKEYIVLPIWILWDRCKICARNIEQWIISCYHKLKKNCLSSKTNSSNSET